MAAEGLGAHHGADHVAVHVGVAGAHPVHHALHGGVHAGLHAKRQAVPGAGQRVEQALQRLAAPADQVQHRAEHFFRQVLRAFQLEQVRGDEQAACRSLAG